MYSQALIITNKSRHVLNHTEGVHFAIMTEWLYIIKIITWLLKQINK